MKQPEKWRETCDPYLLPLTSFKINKVLGYPHAGNDVFYVDGSIDGNWCTAYIKVERQKGADIINEVNIIKQLNYNFVPQILEYSNINPRYIITKEASGERLSTIVGENKELQSLKYMESYGYMLAFFHALKIDCAKVKHRRFFDLPTHDYFVKNNLLKAEEYLNTHEPLEKTECFVHGDFHYANILWEKDSISCVLDYELSGIGIKEFDMAWAIFLRPSQKFLQTEEEINLFLSGYLKLSTFSKKAFYYYYVLIGCYFYTMGDSHYMQKLNEIIELIILNNR